MSADLKKFFTYAGIELDDHLDFSNKMNEVLEFVTKIKDVKVHENTEEYEKDWVYLNLRSDEENLSFQKVDLKNMKKIPNVLDVEE